MYIQELSRWVMAESGTKVAPNGTTSQIACNVSTVTTDGEAMKNSEKLAQELRRDFELSPKCEKVLAEIIHDATHTYGMDILSVRALLMRTIQGVEFKAELQE